MVVSVGVRERLTQEEGVEYDVTFASVAKPMSYKALFPIGADLDLEIEQMDVKTAFLTSKLCKVRKAFCGLKQAPRVWYQTLTNFLRNLGFEPISTYLGILVGSNMHITVYVDDLLIVGPSGHVLPYRPQHFLGRPCRPLTDHLTPLQATRMQYMLPGCPTPLGEFQSLRSFRKCQAALDPPRFPLHWKELMGDKGTGDCDWMKFLLFTGHEGIEE
ncbi:Reverse transcriptase, RNA-dependent DNA polymerase [Penicillium camemberti]|uniref:Reverse transcriptase, RNA-dependent DNA polymerase n=1 Tax=Penicillium camemberti (strain FM 013) TaxID=1429867 RepID=A0A0G4PYR0_PENC3|nr:Reverse transcriptase, RNA-dependent DNA polymerase [Penicillium camemberti]